MPPQADRRRQASALRPPARKRWGQHFLTRPETADRIVQAARVSSEDVVLEVGPGDGALTRPLARAARRVVAVEIDPWRAERLAEELGGNEEGRVVVLTGDVTSRTFRAWLLEAGLEGPALLVANLPYNVATRIVSAALEEEGTLLRIVATVQTEVARRFLARPGDGAYGYLSVRTAARASGRVLFDLPPAAFRPRPRVQSSVLELLPRPPVAEPPSSTRRCASPRSDSGSGARRSPTRCRVSRLESTGSGPWRGSARTGACGRRSSRSRTSSRWRADAPRHERAARGRAMSAPLEVVPLGGVGEFGRNVLWLRSAGSSVLVDVGVSFPDETFPGIDRIAPDLSVLRSERIDGVFLTHGHEDHVGALSFLREWCEAPVYGLPFTLALARRRLEEAQVSVAGLVEATERGPIQAGAFRVTFFKVSHSVPDSAALLIEAGGRRLLHSGDFKLDETPPDGEVTDRQGIAAAVGDGVDLALVDSTNAERPGRSLSEREAGRGLAAAFATARGRIILTTFSSHVARIAQGVDAGMAGGRRIGLLGRSMRAVAEIAERFGRLRLPTGSRFAHSDLRTVPRERLLCLTSGSQGEPFSALYRLALNEHADLELSEGDLVLLSARTIPGHERSVNENHVAVPHAKTGHPASCLTNDRHVPICRQTTLNHPFWQAFRIPSNANSINKLLRDVSVSALWSYECACHARAAPNVENHDHCQFRNQELQARGQTGGTMGGGTGTILADGACGLAGTGCGSERSFLYRRRR